MSKSDAFENALMLLLFNNTNIANIGDATGLRGSTVAGSLYVALHTADPGEAGSATTSEISYTGYARQAVVRSASGFTITGNKMEFVNHVDFPEMTAGTGGVVTHFSVVKEPSGASVVLYKGAVTPNITVAVGVIPRVKGGAGNTNITED